MTRDEWTNSVDPHAMLALFRRRGLDRVVWRFSCACCRRIHDLLPADPRYLDVIQIAERFGEGAASDEDMVAARMTCEHACLDWEATLANSMPHRAAGSAIAAVECLLTGGLDRHDFPDVDAVGIAQGVSNWVATAVWVSKVASPPSEIRCDEVNGEAAVFKATELKKHAELLRRLSDGVDGSQLLVSHGVLVNS
jgi:hypothetical protein